MLIKKIREMNKEILLKLFIMASILFAMPSIIYYLKYRTITNFDYYYVYLLNFSISRKLQSLVYLIIFSILTILYLLILKYRKELFKNCKRIYFFTALISIIFIIVVPVTSSDVFYYLGIGRLSSTYHKNPYYVTITEFVENDEQGSQYMEEDSVLSEGYKNYWSDTTVVYGPVWTIICSIIAKLSFGNFDIGLFLFKLLNVIVHLANCYLIYKISNKKIFSLIYGINPFILLEAIACVHNDIFMILFMLLCLYFFVRKKKILLSIAFLAIATGIKYFSIILLPFLIICYFKDEKPSIRLLKCIEYGIIFAIFFIVPYLAYIRDIHVFQGLFTQQERLAKSFYIMILQFFEDISVSDVNRTLLACFTIIYFFTMIDLLLKKNIKFREEMQKANYFIMAFLFLLITNFQPWYIMWLFPCLVWQKAKFVKLIIQISLISQFSNYIFFRYGEAWDLATPFVFIFAISTLLTYIANNELKLYKRKIKMQEKIIK